MDMLTSFLPKQKTPMTGAEVVQPKASIHDARSRVRSLIDARASGRLRLEPCINRRLHARRRR